MAWPEITPLPHTESVYAEDEHGAKGEKKQELGKRWQWLVLGFSCP